MAARRDHPLRRQATPLSRLSNARNSGPRILVVCGAERTEYDYLIELKRQHGVRTLRVIPQRRGKGKDPEKVVRQAVRSRSNAADTYHEVWCVLDVDKFDLAPAARTALQFGDFGAGLEQAVYRGRRLDKGPAMWPNPSSGMWELVEMIVKGATR